MYGTRFHSTIAQSTYKSSLFIVVPAPEHCIIEVLFGLRLPDHSVLCNIPCSLDQVSLSLSDFPHFSKISIGDVQFKPGAMGRPATVMLSSRKRTCILASKWTRQDKEGEISEPSAIPTHAPSCIHGKGRSFATCEDTTAV